MQNVKIGVVRGLGVTIW